MQIPSNELSFSRTTDQLLEVGLRQMREENERLWAENKRLKEENNILSIKEKQWNTSHRHSQPSPCGSASSGAPSLGQA